MVDGEVFFMDKAIIFGTYEFVGFHLCQEFLERGYEVTGIFHDYSEESFIDEKRLEIGRNANFTEKIIGEYVVDDASPSLMIFSLYDLFIGSREKLINSEDLRKIILKTVDTRNQIAYLLPIQLLSQSDHMQDLKLFLEDLKGIGKNPQFYYLPSIFGPWQPVTFLFQKSMLNLLGENSNPNAIREWRMDAIFVKDAVKTLIEKMISGNEGHFLLESGIPNQWEDCADFLKIDPQFRESKGCEELELGEHIIHLPVKQGTPFADALRLQRKHLKNVTTF
jgi:hypothetical protein